MTKARKRKANPREIPRHEAKPRIVPLPTFEWPTEGKIAQAQQEASGVPRDIQIREEGEARVMYYKGRIWIPENEQLKTQLVVVAHYGLGGHNGLDGTKEKLKAFCTWTNMEEDIRRVIDDCILCRMAKGDMPTRKHLGEHVKPTGPNQIVSTDYFWMGESKRGYKYLIVIRDCFSRFTYLRKSRH